MMPIYVAAWISNICPRPRTPEHMPTDNPSTLVEECVNKDDLISKDLNSISDSKKLVNSTVFDESYLRNSNEM